MKIIISCGGTGGHMFPALATADSIKKNLKHSNILIVTTPNVARSKDLYDIKFPVDTILASGVPDKIDAGIFSVLIVLFAGFLKSLIILFRFRPDVIVGFGSYATVPLILGGAILNIPVILHEQNAVPGRANLKLAKFAKVIALSWGQSEAYFCKKPGQRIIITGNPIRPSICRIEKKEALENLSFDADKFTILVIGGSQGAEQLNMKFCDAVALMAKDEKSKLQVVHVTGKNTYDHISERYIDLNVDNNLFSFCKDMSAVYSAADLVISRAGANAICEISFFGLPSILVPYPYSRAHQRENAAILEAEAAVVIEEDKLAAATFKKVIMELLNDKARLTKMGKASRDAFTDGAADRLAKEVIAVKG